MTGANDNKDQKDTEAAESDSDTEIESDLLNLDDAPHLSPDIASNAKGLP
jgi:hypothetical protein